MTEMLNDIRNAESRITGRLVVYLGSFFGMSLKPLRQHVVRWTRTLLEGAEKSCTWT